jgi:murein L,D-transpeptidase YcbB/YkuD
MSSVTACSREIPERQVTAQQPQRIVDRAALDHRPAYVGSDQRSNDAWNNTRAFYDSHGDAFVWSDDEKPNAKHASLTRAIVHASEDGLDPRDYDTGTFDPAQAAQSDVHATYAFFQYAADLSHGTIDPETINPQWHTSRRSTDVAAALNDALASGDVAGTLSRLAPRTAQYLGLKHHLADCADENCRQIVAMNMDRWRWLPDDLGSRYLVVNIPAFRLDAIEDGRSALRMKVVTGKKDNPTPVLSDDMTTIVFSPYWNIPDDIVKREMLPKLDQDPQYFERNNIEQDANGRYRQLPGKGNSLGGVAFIFPNHFNVYLHDTPSKALFNRIERDFSHGCVRVERPLDLAKYVLHDQPEWTEVRIKAAMARGVEQAVRLKTPLPIYLVYFTAWEENGTLRTVADVYGLDRRQRSASGA